MPVSLPPGAGFCPGLHSAAPPPPCPRRCDEQILPAVYAWVGASFDATPTQLGAITLGRAMMQALSSPLGGVAGQSRGAV